MARSHDRGRRGEDRVAKLTGATRIKHRPRYTRSADFWPLRLPNGEVLQLESKAGESVIPKKVAKDIAQARSYAPDAVPIAVYSDVGGDAVACLPLQDFARLLQIGPPRATQAQLTLSRAPVDGNDATEDASRESAGVSSRRTA